MHASRWFPTALCFTPVLLPPGPILSRPVLSCHVLSSGTGDKTVTFLGSHLDVVPANPETWEVGRRVLSYPRVTLGYKAGLLSFGVFFMRDYGDPSLLRHATYSEDGRGLGWQGFGPSPRRPNFLSRVAVLFSGFSPRFRKDLYWRHSHYRVSRINRSMGRPVLRSACFRRRLDACMFLCILRSPQVPFRF